MEVVLGDGSVSRETADVLHKWKQDFSSLLNCQNSYDIRAAENSTNQNIRPPDPLLEVHISILEVKKAVDNAQRGSRKACSSDAIPIEVLCTDTCVSFLHYII